MANKCKRFLSLLLAFVMVLGMFPVGHAHAEAVVDGTTINMTVGETYTFDNVDGDYSNLTGNDYVSVDVEFTPQMTGTYLEETTTNETLASGTYVLLNTRAGEFLESTSEGNKLWLAAKVIDTAEKWVITSVDGGYTMQASNGQYMTFDGSSSGLTDAKTVLNFVWKSGTSTWQIGLNGQYLNSYDSENKTAGWWQDGDTGSQWKLYKLAAAPAYTWTLGEQVSQIKDGGYYIFENNAASSRGANLASGNWSNTNNGGGGTGFGLKMVNNKTNFTEQNIWKITGTAGNYNVQHLRGWNLFVARGKATLTAERNAVVIGQESNHAGKWQISVGGVHLNWWGGANGDGVQIAGWGDVNDGNSQWNIYEVIPTRLGTSDVTIEAKAAGETEITIGGTTYTIIVAAACEHEYDNDCDAECNLCGETREVGEHVWEDATCTAPKTCSVCQATEGEALGHTYEREDGDANAVKCGDCGTANPNYQPVEVAPEVNFGGETESEVVPENVKDEIIEDVLTNEAVNDYKPVEKHDDVEELEITFTSATVKNETPTALVFTVTPKMNGQKVSNPSEPITFRLPVPNSVAQAFAKVFHDGIQMDGLFEVKADNGNKYVEIESDSFSEYRVKFTDETPAPTVVEVATLAQFQAALADNSNELPIVITARIEIPVGETVVLDLNGKTVTVPESTGNHIYALNNKGNLTIKDSKGNGSITARGIYNGYDGTSSDNTVAGAKLTIESGKFVGMDADGGAAIFNCAELIINGGDFSGGVCAVNNRKMGVATINGGEFHGVSSGSYVIQNNGGVLTIENASVDSGFGAVGCYSGTTTIKNGTFLPTGRPAATCHVVYVAGAATVDIQGGTFKMNYPAEAVPDSGSAVASYYNGNLTITGGTFTAHFDNVSPVELSQGAVISGGTFKVHSGAPSNHNYIKNFLDANVELGEDGVVEKIPAVAKIGEQGYKTLNEAFAAAVEGDTIILLADATPALTSQRAITKAAVIDLNGKTLTLNKGDLYFGTTTFQNGKIVVDPSVFASTAVFWMFEGQNLTFNCVEIVATGVTGTYLIGINGGSNTAVKLIGSKIIINNTDKTGLGTVICDNGNGNSVVIESCDIDVSNIDGRFYLGGTNGTVTVKDSDVELVGVKEGFYIRAGQTLSIKGDSNVEITLNDTNGRYGINVTDDSATYEKAETATVTATVYVPPFVKNEVTKTATIKNLEGLKQFRDEVNGGNTFAGWTVVLTSNIDLGNEEWTPIGYMGKTFKGTFDGGNFTISNLKITKELANAAANNGIGFFGRTDDTAVIKNLIIENVDITGSLYVGAVVGFGYTGKLVENVTVKGNITIDAWWYAGVIGGNGYMNLVNNCHVIGNEGSYIKGNNGSYIGGIWGFRGEGNNKITNCSVEGLDIIGVDRVGGICGIGHYGNSISGCAAEGVTITATDPEATTVGLIVGACQGTASEPTVFENNTLTDTTAQIDNGDGTYTKVENLYGTKIDGSESVTNFAAKIGSKIYLTLADAVAAAKAGDEIVLLADVTESVTMPAGVVFNGNGKTVSGTIKAGGNLTFKGQTTVSTFNPNGYNNIITIGEGASLKVTSGRMTVSYGNVFNITGSIVDAKTADKTAITPSLELVGGISYTGNGSGVQFNATNAYIKLGDSTTKNSVATGEFNMNFDNCIVDFTKTLKTYMPTGSGLAPKFNFNAKDSVVNFASHLELWLDATTMTLDNTDLTVGGSFANAGKLNVENGSNFVVKAPIMSSHGGNTGTIAVKDASFELKDSNEDWQNAGTMTAEGTGKLITIDFKNTGDGKVVLKSLESTFEGKQGITVTSEVEGYEVTYNETTQKYEFTKAPVAKIGEQKFQTLEEAFKAATEGCTIEILQDVTIDSKWDCRDYAANGSHSQFKESVTINGNGHTIKFTGTVSDGNWNTIFRFEENAKVNNLTIDISEATGAQRVITAKKSLTVDGLTIIGSAKYGIIFGEGSSAADLAAAEIVVKNSTLTGTRRAISDNEGGKDVKSVTVTGNTLNANVYVSASESVVFNSNTTNGEVDIRSYSADNVLSVKAQGNNLTEGKKNYIYAKEIDAQPEFTTKRPAFKVSTKAELNAALAAAQEGDTIVLTADIDYGTDHLKIEKAITLDLGGKTLTTRARNYGLALYNGCTVTNGKLNHAGTVAAIKVWDAKMISDLEIDVTGTSSSGNTIDGIVIQENATGVDTIKNVTIHSTAGQGVDSGIKTYNCGNATEPVIGSMEYVTVDAKTTGLNISAPCGTATNCSISGGVNGIELWIKGTYSASLDLVNSKVEGGVYAHDEFASNVTNNGTLTLTVDEDTTGVSAEDVTLTINHAEEEQVKGDVLENIIENAQAKVNGTYYATIAEAMKAAKAGDTVYVLEGTYDMPDMKAGITIEGVGEVQFNGTLSGTLENLTLKNIHIKGSNAQRWAYAKGDLVFENVTFEATGVYALHFDGIAAGTNLLYKDCTIIGWAAMGGSPASCVFDGCTIKGNGTYGVIRTYFDATIENCTFDVANVNPNDPYQDGIHAVDATVTVENCTNANGDMNEIIDTNGKGYINIVGDQVYHFHDWKKGETFAPDFGVDGYTVYTCPCGETKHYDIVTAMNTAKIGNVGYKTLADAVAAATPGQTIKLLGNATGAGVVIDKDITINFGGFTYTINEPVGSAGTESNGFQILSGNKVTLINGGMKVADSAADKFYTLIQNYADLTITHMNLDGTNLDKWSKTDGDSYVVSINSGNVIINGKTTITANDEGEKAYAFDVCKFANYAEPTVLVKGTATINGKIEAYVKIGETYYATLQQAVNAADAKHPVQLIADASGAGVVIDNDLTIQFNGFTYTITEPVGSAGTESNGFQILNGHNVILKNGGIKVADSAAGKFYILIQNYSNLTVSDMALDGANLDKYPGESYVLSNNSGKVLLNGKTVINANEGEKAFAFDACKFANYDAPVVTVNATVTINGEVEAVAMIKNTYYATLQQAIDAAASGKTITLVGDINLNNVDPVLLDNAYNTYFKVEGKTVTIDLNGKTISGEYADTSKMLVGVFSTEKGGHLTLTGNGTVNLTEGEGATVYSLMSNYDHDCTITIVNGSYTLNSAWDCLLHSSCDKGLIIKGGNFELGNVGKGHWTGNRGNGSPWIINVNGQNTGAAVVSGGTYNYDISNQRWIFEVDIQDGKGNLGVIVNNGDGTWTVTGLTAEAAIANYPQGIERLTGYATLADAIAAAKAGQTVLLMKDVALEKSVAIAGNRNVVIDLNGNILSSAKAHIVTCYYTKTTITIKDSVGGGKVLTTGSGKHAFVVQSNLVIDGAEISSNKGGNAIVAQTANANVTIQNDAVINGKVVVKAGAMTITSGTFNDKLEITAGVKVEISGGYFKYPVKAEWCAEGYIPTGLLENGYYSVMVDPAYNKDAMIERADGNGYYVTLAEAFADAKDGETVTVLRDLAIDTTNLVANSSGYAAIYNIAGKAITLDLNSKKIEVTVNADDMADYKDGILLGVFCVDTNGALTLTGNGTVTANLVDGPEDPTVSKLYSLMVAYGAGSKLTVMNGTYHANSVNSALVYSQYDEIVTINGGTYTLGNLGKGRNGSPWLFNAKGQNERNILVNDGTFAADILHQYYPFEVQMPKELALSKNADGMYTVVDAVAYVNEQKWSSKWYTNYVGYATVEEAEAAANGVKTKVIGKNTYYSDCEVVTLLVKGEQNLEDVLNGETENVALPSGNFTLPTTSGEVSISGSKDTVININTVTAEEISMNGVTVKSSGAAYTGIQNSEKVVFTDCTIVGNMYLYAEEVVFTNCTFDLSTTNDYIWVYGATNVTFKDCTFNTMGKAILVFQDGSSVDQTVTVEGCTFNASQKAQTATGLHVAAVSIDGKQGGTYNVVLNNNTVDSNFNDLWQDKTSAGNITVTVDGNTMLTAN